MSRRGFGTWAFTVPRFPRVHRRLTWCVEMFSTFCHADEVAPRLNAITLQKKWVFVLIVRKFTEFSQRCRETRGNGWMNYSMNMEHGRIVAPNLSILAKAATKQAGVIQCVKSLQQTEWEGVCYQLKLLKQHILGDPDLWPSFCLVCHSSLKQMPEISKNQCKSIYAFKFAQADLGMFTPAASHSSALTPSPKYRKRTHWHPTSLGCHLD